MRLRDTRGFNENVVEFLLLRQLDDLLHQVGLEGAADAAILHPDHGLVTLDQGGLVNQTLVNVELGHVVDNDGTLEILFIVFGLEDMFQQSCFPRTKEATK